MALRELELVTIGEPATCIKRDKTTSTTAKSIKKDEGKYGDYKLHCSRKGKGARVEEKESRF